MPEPITIIGMGSGVVALGTHLARRYFEVAKEIMDVVLAAMMLVLCLPLLAVCALIIKLSGRGPIIFTQIRAGKDGKPFKMYKLRSMRVDAEAQSGAVWAADKDPRIMPACRWMRKSHVDELPQLINVIKGDMSLVGPRPERAEILDELEKVYPDIRKRLRVRPGITGLAQIQLGYDTTVEAYRRKLEADLEYIDSRRWSNELRILAATAAKVVDNTAH
jgi:lipopolysaccharide/colanic/teichoic acid biosynthesis glycosyltransferase